jgi:hypothetical protein
MLYIYVYIECASVLAFLIPALAHINMYIYTCIYILYIYIYIYIYIECVSVLVFLIPAIADT